MLEAVTLYLTICREKIQPEPTRKVDAMSSAYKLFFPPSLRSRGRHVQTPNIFA